MGDLTSTFKSAANAVALLYKESLSSSQRAHEAGYNACLQDLWTFLSLQASREPVSPGTSTIHLADLETFFRAKLFELHNKEPTEPSKEINDFEASSSTAFEGMHVTTAAVESHSSDSLKRRWNQSMDIGPNGAQRTVIAQMDQMDSPTKRSRIIRHPHE